MLIHVNESPAGMNVELPETGVRIDRVVRFSIERTLDGFHASAVWRIDSDETLLDAFGMSEPLDARDDDDDAPRPRTPLS